MHELFIYFSVCYIILICCIIYKITRNKTFYIFSPLLFFCSFIVSDILPLCVPQPYEIHPVIYRNTINAIVINVFFIIFYWKTYKAPLTINIPTQLYLKTNKNRKHLIILCLSILFISGIVAGTLTGFLKGENMEDKRRTAEVGIGFIRTLPDAILMPIVFVYLVKELKNKWIKSAIICIAIGLFEMILSGGNRAPLLMWAIIFLCYYALTRRGLKWYEYFAYLSAINIGGVIVGAIRKGLSFGDDLQAMTLFDLLAGNQNIFFHNSILLVQYCENNNVYFHSEELYNAITYFIPRFLWEDKPVSFGYKLKELMGWDFEGGGIGATYLENTYINWGDLWWIHYILWIFLIHWIYKKILYTKSYFWKVLLIILSATCINEKEMIIKIELLIMACIIYALTYNKKNTI